MLVRTNYFIYIIKVKISMLFCHTEGKMFWTGWPLRARDVAFSMFSSQATSETS